MSNANPAPPGPEEPRRPNGQPRDHSRHRPAERPDAQPGDRADGGAGDRTGERWGEPTGPATSAGGGGPDDPARVPGLDEGGGVPPGETPPGEDSTAGAGPRDTQNPSRGWAKAPMVILTLVVACFVVYFLVWAVKL